MKVIENQRSSSMKEAISSSISNAQHIKARWALAAAHQRSGG